MHNVETIREEELSDGQIESIVRLTNSVWPKEGLVLQERIETLLTQIRSGERTSLSATRFVVFEDREAIAHALVFERTIFPLESDTQSISVLALAGVCSAGERRGQGLGAAVV